MLKLTTDVVRLLIDVGKVDTEAVDNNGKTPLDLAREREGRDRTVVLDVLTKSKQND